VLARLRRLRGTRLDLFGRSEERRAERRLIAEYETLLDEIVDRLTSASYAAAVELASLPLEIRGFGHVKEAEIARAKAQEAALLTGFRAAPTVSAIAAE
jgi:indolepyruvate ferredoxin oxidoreductase